MADIKIYGKLINATTDNIIVGADQTYDETLGKFQSDINTEVLEKLNEKSDLNPITLTNQDLNVILASGFYNSNPGNSVTNKPAGVDAFGLHIYTTSSEYIVQELTSGNTNPGAAYYRQHNGSGWTVWQIKAGLFNSNPISGQVLKSDEFGRLESTGFTIASNVPADAKFTDTTYTIATPEKDGLLSKEDKKILDDVVAHKIQTITRAEYDAILEKDPNQIYYIKG